MDKKLSEFYGLSILKDLIWQDKALSFWDPVSGLPESPTVPDRYVASVSGGPSGEEWTKNYIYEWYFDQWVEIVPKTGTVILISENSKYYYFNGSNWVLFDTIIDHDELNGTLGGEYHLDETTYNNVNSQDQSLKTTDDVTLNDITITTPTTIYNSLNHDDFNDYVANEHINHSNININAGTGLSGGGDLTTNRELSLDADLNNLNDVDNTAPQDGQILIWNQTDNKWEISSKRLLNAAYIETFTGSSIVITHNLSVPQIFVATYEGGIQISPINIEILNDNQVLVEFSELKTFTAVIMEPGAPVETVLSLIKFKGSWSGLTGSLDIPASSYHNSKFWVLLESVADVTLEEPGISTKWVTIYDGVENVLSTLAGEGLVYIDGVMHLDAFLNDLEDVELISITEGQVMMYEGGVWTNKDIVLDDDAVLNSTTYGNYRIEHNDIEDSLDFIYDSST